MKTVSPADLELADEVDRTAEVLVDGQTRPDGYVEGVFRRLREVEMVECQQ